MPFKFRLKPLKRHREFKLSSAQTALGAAVSRKMRILAETEELVETIRRQTEQFELDQENGMETARYLHFKSYLAYLERELLLAYRKLKKAAVEVESCKQAVIDCDKSVKTLESIETRDKALYRLNQSRKEQKRLDDLTVLGVCRPSRQERGES